MSREPQPEKGTILLICFEAMFERMSLFYVCKQSEAFRKRSGIMAHYSVIIREECRIIPEECAKTPVFCRKVKYIYLLRLPRVRAHVREISILGGIKGEFKKKAYKEKYLAGLYHFVKSQKKSESFPFLPLIHHRLVFVEVDDFEHHH